MTAGQRDTLVAPTLTAGEGHADTACDGSEPHGANGAGPTGLVGDRYLVERLLGSGGMSVVFAAHDQVLARSVALKVIRGRTGDVADGRLVREARAMARLSHPNVIQVFDVGVAANGPVYVAMELVDGVTLDRWLDGSPDPTAIVATFRAAGRGLAAAHAAGLVHRDFKPANVMVGHDGRVRVLDFGLARAAEPGPPSADPAVPFSGVTAATALTATGAIAGTPRYMSPEQWRGEPTDARTDQFSFCIALAAALGGRHPFDDASVETQREAVLAGAMRPLPSMVPAWIVPVLRRGLAHRRDDRFPTMDELVSALEPPVVSRRRWANAAWLAVAAVAILAGMGVAAWRVLDDGGVAPPSTPTRSSAAPAATATAVATPPAPAGYGCGPYFHTYAVQGRGDTRGVRCVMLARDQDGTPWLAWYGEGVHDGVRYRHIGEGHLGGVGSAAEIIGNGEGSGKRFDRSLRLEPADSSSPPPRITVGGAWDERWIRTAGVHAGYTSTFTEPIRVCGPHLSRYRVFPKWEQFWGFSIACVMPGGRTWLGAGHWHGNPHLHVGTSSFENGVRAPIASDVCYVPRAACGAARHGDLTMQPREFPGIGAGLDVSGVWPLVWFPWSRRYALRIHTIRIVDDERRDDAPTSVADIARAVARANELLEPAGFEVFFVADEKGPDVETVSRSRLGGAASDDALRSYAQTIHTAQPYKIVVFVRAGAHGGCPPSSPHDLIVLPTADDVAGCATPWADRLAHALADQLGFSRIPDRPLAPAEAARVEELLRARKLE